MKRLIKFLSELKEKGLLSDFSKKHLLIRALNNDFDFFNKYKEFKKNSFFQYETCDKVNTFLINFSVQLEIFSKYLETKDFYDFIQNQLSAGKNNYDENQFLRAVSEVNVLNYLFQYTGLKNKVKYEPNLNGNGKNPEARIIIKDGTIFDIEVKTPGFAKKIELDDKEYLLRPNTILNKIQKEKLQAYCDKYKIKLMFPRVLKLKEFIKSAVSKFETPTSKKHYNILVINWTYTEFYDLKLREPINLLVNPINGILNLNDTISQLDITRSEIEKLSAIIVYQDNIDTIISQDFCFHIANNSVTVIGNEKYNKLHDYEDLYKKLRLNTIDRNSFKTKWNPSDYAIKEGISTQTIDNAQLYFNNLIMDEQKDEIILSSKTERF